MGIVSVRCVRGFTIVRWLPFWRSSRQPCFLKKRMSFLAVVDGSRWLTRLGDRYRFLQHGQVGRQDAAFSSVLREILNEVQALRVYSCAFLQSFFHWRNNREDLRNR